MQLIALLRSHATATPQSLGDTRKETPEDLQNRYERVLCCTCAALSSLVNHFSDDDALTSSIKTILCGDTPSSSSSPSLLKTVLHSKTAMASPRVRRAGYLVITCVCQSAPHLLSSSSPDASTILGCLGDKEPGNHASMWGMVLSFAKSHPDSFQYVNIQKAVMPKLLSLLRHTFYTNSSSDSYQAILPFLALLPSPEAYYDGVLNAVWDGISCTGGGPGGTASGVNKSEVVKQGGAECIQECFVYACRKHGVEVGVCQALTGSVIELTLMPVATAAVDAPSSQLARSILIHIVSALQHPEGSSSSAPSSSSSLKIVCEAVGRRSAVAVVVSMEQGREGGSLSAVRELLLGLKIRDTSLRIETLKPVVMELLSHANAQQQGATSYTEGATALLASLIKAVPELKDTSTTSTGDLPPPTSISSISVDPMCIADKIVQEHNNALIDLLVSCLSPQDHSVFVGVLMKLNEEAGAVATASFVSQFMSHHLHHHHRFLTSDEVIHQVHSPRLDEYIVHLCGSLKIDSNSNAYCSLVEMLLNGSNRHHHDGAGIGGVSFATPQGLEAALLRLRHGIDAKNVDALRISSSVVLVLPSSSGSDFGEINARLQLIASIYRILVEESCRLLGKDDDEDSTSGSSTGSSSSNGTNGEDDDMYDLAMSVWSEGEGVAALLTYCSPHEEAKRRCIQSLVEITRERAEALHAYKAAATPAVLVFSVLSLVRHQQEGAGHSTDDVDAFVQSLYGALNGNLAFFTAFSEDGIGLAALMAVHLTQEQSNEFGARLVSSTAVQYDSDVVALRRTFLEEIVVPENSILVMGVLWALASMGGSNGDSNGDGGKRWESIGVVLHTAIGYACDDNDTAIQDQEELLLLKRHALDFFRENIVEKAEHIHTNALVTVLGHVAPLLRQRPQSESDLSLSGLDSLTAAACTSITGGSGGCSDSADGRGAAVDLVAACFPTPRAPPPIPQFLLNTCSDDKINTAVYSIGDQVWYRHREGHWEASEVVSVDTSITPASYGVKLSSGIRETEAIRLKKYNDTNEDADDDATQLALSFLDMTLEESSLHHHESVHTTHEEREALKGVLHSLLNDGSGGSGQVEEGPPVSTDISLVLHTSIAILGNAFTQSDWEGCLAALCGGTGVVAEAMASAAEAVAVTVTRQAEIMSGSDLGSAEAALSFFNRLYDKGVLEMTSKGVVAVQKLKAGVSSALTEVSTLHGRPLYALLQAYCYAAKGMGRNKTCPLLLWESSQAQVCSNVLDCFVSLGKIYAQAALCGVEVEVVGEKWMVELGRVVTATLAVADRLFLGAVVDRANARRGSDGIGCTDALVALILSSSTSTTSNGTARMCLPAEVRDAAHRALLLHPEMIQDLVMYDEETVADDHHHTQLLSWSEQLERGGVSVLLASVAGDPSHPSFLTAWALLVAHILLVLQNSNISSTMMVVECIKEAHGMLHRVLDEVAKWLPLNKSTTGSSNSSMVTVYGAKDTSARGFARRLCALGVVNEDSRWALDDENDDVATSIRLLQTSFATLLYAGLLRALPASCRLWYGDVGRDKGMAAAVEKYTATAVSAGLLAAEYDALNDISSAQTASVAAGDKPITVVVNGAAREVVAAVEVEDVHSIELVIKLPACMPLKPPEAEFRRYVGVSEARRRKWLLSVTAFLRNRNGAVADALALWKRNVDQEFAGFEDCLICYSVIQPSTGQLPKLTCKTCRKKFHGTCLYKWFATGSLKSSCCPHCQSPW